MNTIPPIDMPSPLERATPANIDTSSGIAVDALLQQIETDIRREPVVASHRWRLFQWLCVRGDWRRALVQLQFCAKHAADMAQTAFFYRELIRAEQYRARVFAGQRRPQTLLPPPAWFDLFADAQQSCALGDMDAADARRDYVFAAASPRSGHSNLGAFSWLVDSDTRLGPVCELIAHGQYAWLPFEQIATIKLPAPATPLDLVWCRAELTLVDGSRRTGAIPVRYPGSEQGDDAIRLGRRTTWQTVGKTGVLGLGQKTWTTEHGDFGLLDLRECHFAVADTVMVESTMAPQP